MNNEFFKSERYFSIFDFLISHRQLLLRSDKIKGYPKNIDIIIFDTVFLQLPTSLDGLSIRVADHALGSHESISKFLNASQSQLFEIRSGTAIHYVVGAFVRVFENDLEFHETSLGVTQFKGRENEISASKR